MIFLLAYLKNSREYSSVSISSGLDEATRKMLGVIHIAND